MKTKNKEKHLIWPLYPKVRPIYSRTWWQGPSSRWLIFGIAMVILLLLLKVQQPVIVVNGYTSIVKREQVIRNQMPGTVAALAVESNSYLKKDQLIYQLACDKLENKLKTQHQKIQHYQNQIESLISDWKNSSHQVGLLEQIKLLDTQIQTLTRSNQQLQLEQKQYRVFAPIDGTLRWVDHFQAGDQMNAGTLVGTIIGKDSLISVFQISKQQMKRLILDQSVRIKNKKQHQIVPSTDGWIQQIHPINQGKDYLIYCSLANPFSAFSSNQNVLGYFPARSFLQSIIYTLLHN